jgi:hypothetical protein
MDNSEKYHFSDFTHDHYRVLLEKAKARFKFVSYDQIKSESNFIVWRHDVDFSMHEALRLAKIESEMQVKAIYFLLPHCEFYNLFEKKISEKVSEIAKLGHELALHFDASYYGIKTKEELEIRLLFEKELIERLFDVRVNAFSFHNPSEEILKFDDFQYAGMVNTYSSFFKQTTAYCSDSNGHWRFKRMLEVICDPQVQSLQALTHPEWWTLRVMSPKEKIWRCIDGRAKSNKDFYIDLLIKHNRLMIDW